MFTLYRKRYSTLARTFIGHTKVRAEVVVAPSHVLFCLFLALAEEEEEMKIPCTQELKFYKGENFTERKGKRLLPVASLSRTQYNMMFA